MPASFKCYQEIRKIFREKEMQEEKEKQALTIASKILKSIEELKQATLDIIIK